MRTSQQINVMMDEKLKSPRAGKLIFFASGRQRIIAIIVFTTIAMFFAAFAIAGHSNVDMGNYLGRCGFRAMYHLPCPTCEYTTATLAFTQGRIFEAFNLQPACALLCSILVFTGLVSFIIAVFGINFGFVRKFFAEVKIRHIVLALIIIILSGWAVTLSRTIANN
ncbi:MAG: DUF2752 domain-containing protein [Sedimentisphaerales bacterium]